MDYFRPDTALEAAELLASFGGEAKILAGGQSLMPLINMRLARPAVLIDVNRVAELDFVRRDDGVLTIGATTRHFSVGRSDVVRQTCPLLTEATRLIGSPSVRARATFGGSMAHADPSAEYPSVAVAMGAELVARGPAGERRLAAAEFFTGPLSTALADDELLVEVRLPAQPPGEGWAYLELATRPGDYATVGVVARIQLDADRRCQFARLVYTSVGPTPVDARRAARTLVGEVLSPDAFAAAAAVAVEEVEPESDALSSATYKRAMTRVMTGRALTAALERAVAA